MRFARKLMLLAVAAVAVLAMSASSAMAVSVHTEDPAGPCGAVTVIDHGVGSGGCKIHATSTSPVELGTALGMIFCDNEFEARVDEAGAGFIYSQTLTNCTSNVAPCNESGVNDNWPVNLTSETTMEADFCVRAFGLINVACHLNPINVTQLAHDEVIFDTDGHVFCEGSGSNSVDGNWVGEVDANHPELIIED